MGRSGNHKHNIFFFWPKYCNVLGVCHNLEDSAKILISFSLTPQRICTIFIDSTQFDSIVLKSYNCSLFQVINTIFVDTTKFPVLMKI